MSDTTILDKILTRRHAEEIRIFDPVEVVNELISTLSYRERNILTQRYGLPDGLNIETLEGIGKRFKVTRERVRQITRSSVAKLRSLNTNNEHLRRFVRTTEQLLRSYGGALEKNFFISELLSLARVGDSDEAKLKAKVCLIFLLDNVMSDVIERRAANKELRVCYALPSVDCSNLAKVVKIFVDVFNDVGAPLGEEELLRRFRETAYYKEHHDELIIESVRVAREFYASGINPDEPQTEEEEARVFLALVAASALLKKNIFGEWGRADWSTVNPRRMNDKIYLMLRHNGEPLHFVNIAEKVNEIKFDKKIAKPASVHNELILDKRFVLVGRGIYALREWGYKPGTVADVIERLLRKTGALTREDIVKQVLKKRLVKQQTIHLALLNRARFQKLNDNRYTLVGNYMSSVQ